MFYRILEKNCFDLCDLEYDRYRSRWPWCRMETCFLNVSSHFFGKKKDFDLWDLEYDLYRIRWACCRMDTCFLDVSSNFGEFFFPFLTLNMTFIVWGDLVATWKKNSQCFISFWRKKLFLTFVTHLERSRVKNFIALHIYTIAPSYNNQELRQYLTYKGHWLTFKGHKVKIWSCCTWTL